MPFEYEWQQDGQDPATGRITCRIHFDLDFGERLDNAFVYDWRLWKPQELISLSEQAGFASSALWWSDPMEPGRYQPVQEAPANQDWVGYVVCQAPIADKG